MIYVRESARLTLFLWIWSEKARALVAWSAVRRPPLVYALTENKEAEESDLQHGNSPSDGIHNYFLQWAMLPLPCPTHQPSLCLCQAFLCLLLWRTSLKTFNCSCRSYRLGLSSQTMEKSKWPWPVHTTTSSITLVSVRTGAYKRAFSRLKKDVSNNHIRVFFW